MKGIEKRYRKALAEIPAPGTGCHPFLLGVATLAIRAGRRDEQALEEIRAAIPEGDRLVDDQEIIEAIERAHQDTTAFAHGRASRGRITPRRRTVSEIRAAVVEDETNAEKLRRAVIEAGGGELDLFELDVWERSPIPIEPYSKEFPYAGGMLPLLRHLYSPEDRLLIGPANVKAQPGKTIRTAAEWAAFFENELAWISEQPQGCRQIAFQRLGERYPLVTPNPLTGLEGEKKEGGLSFRADSCVREYRFIIVEFDHLKLSEQLEILRGLCRLDAKIAAIIYSGGKSFHAWLRCEGVTTAEEWQAQVKDGLFSVLTKLGADPACKNPSHLSRLPGVLRSDSGEFQQLLYLAPEGGTL